MNSSEEPQNDSTLISQYLALVRNNISGFQNISYYLHKTNTDATNIIDRYLSSINTNNQQTNEQTEQQTEEQTEQQTEEQNNQQKLKQ